MLIKQKKKEKIRNYENIFSGVCLLLIHMILTSLNVGDDLYLLLYVCTYSSKLQIWMIAQP